MRKAHRYGYQANGYQLLQLLGTTLDEKSTQQKFVKEIDVLAVLINNGSVIVPNCLEMTVIISEMGLNEPIS